MLSIVVVVANFDEIFNSIFFFKKKGSCNKSISFPKYFLQNGEKFATKESLGKIRGEIFHHSPYI
jgi:hypothetical protein